MADGYVIRHRPIKNSIYQFSDFTTGFRSYGGHNHHCDDRSSGQQAVMKTYTPAEASKILDIPDSSLRRLARQFSDQLSPKQSRRRRFTNKDLEVLRLAREMLADRLTVDQVRGELTQRLENVIDVDQEETESETSPLALAIRQLDQRFSSLQNDLDQLRQDRQADQERIRRLEDDLAQPFWKRWFKKRSED